MLVWAIGTQSCWRSSGQLCLIIVWNCNREVFIPQLWFPTAQVCPIVFTPSTSDFLLTLQQEAWGRRQERSDAAGVEHGPAIPAHCVLKQWSEEKSGLRGCELEIKDGQHEWLDEYTCLFLATSYLPFTVPLSLTFPKVKNALGEGHKQNSGLTNIHYSVIVVQSLSCVQLFAASWTAACPAFLSFTISQSLLKLMSIESVMPSNHLILCHPLLILPSIFPNIRVFSSESAVSIRWPKYWSFSFSSSPSNEYSRLTSFSIDWFDLLAVQGTLKSLLQHHNLKAPILQCSAFFKV